ncbi:pickpocket protein 28-like [Aedes albopictus]|uniref:Amiloride-sensitive sodium channel n=1 Tax=Aedes albopictus TaxID=7160 RepID=A0ABM1ZMK7_AEDAL
MPIVVNYENQQISVTDFPFPAFTICHPCQIFKPIPMKKFLERCAFNGPSSCEHLLHYVMTDMGLCVSFNLLQNHRIFRNGSFGGLNDLNAKHVSLHGSSNSTLSDLDVWFPEEGYIRSQTNGMLPLRGLGAGKYRAFDLILTTYKEDMSYECKSSPIRGHSIILHSPADYPFMVNSVVIPFEHVTQIAAKPLVVKTHPKLRKHPPEKRQCFFENERNLTYFRIYTQNNCLAECLTNYTLSRCGCVKFSMVRSEETRVCEPVACFRHAIQEFVTIENPYRRISGGKIPTVNAFDARKKCNCLPSCTSYQFDFEILQHSFNSSGNIDGVQAYVQHLRQQLEQFQSFFISSTTLSRDYLGTLSVFFKEPHFIAKARSEQYELTDLIANCGGLLGLFTGTSLLSLIEIVYFCSLRPLVKFIGWIGGIVDRHRKPSLSVAKTPATVEKVPCCSSPLTQ